MKTEDKQPETANKMIITVRQRLEDIFNKPFNGHPSREDEHKMWDSLRFLADQIDRLHELRIKKK